MLKSLLATHTTDPDLAARGPLLKGASLLVATAAFLFLVQTFFNPATDRVFQLVLFGIGCLYVGTFFLAQYGFIGLGGAIIAGSQLIFVTFFGEPENILSGTAGAIYLIPILIAGMVIGAKAVVPTGALALLLISAVPMLRGVAWNQRVVVTLFVLGLTTALLWLIIRMLERALDRARQQTVAAEQDKAEIAAREVSLQTANGNLQAANDQLEDLLRLVRELETPVIPLLDHVLVAPLVGHLDTRRAEQVTQAVLDTVYAQKASTVIIDITGIQVMDTQVVQHLDRLAQAVQLLGAQVVMTGIRPEVAQTITMLGLTLNNIRTHSRLQDGVTAVLHNSLRVSNN